MNKQHPRVMVAGATGYIGGGVLQVLYQKGFWIRALCRDPSRLINPNWCQEIFVGHATRPETLKGLCEGIDIVFSSTELAFQVLGKEPCIKTIPAWMVCLIASLLRPFNYNAYALCLVLSNRSGVPEKETVPLRRT